MDKLSTGIPGFDEISIGGLPLRRTTLITGTARSGMHIGIPFRDVSGIISGTPYQFIPGELNRLSRLHPEGT